MSPKERVLLSLSKMRYWTTCCGVVVNVDETYEYMGVDGDEEESPVILDSESCLILIVPEEIVVTVIQMHERAAMIHQKMRFRLDKLGVTVGEFMVHFIVPTRQKLSVLSLTRRPCFIHAWLQWTPLH